MGKEGHFCAHQEQGKLNKCSAAGSAQNRTAKQQPRGSRRLSASQELHPAASFNAEAEQLVFPASCWCWFLRSHHHTKQKLE